MLTLTLLSAALPLSLGLTIGTGLSDCQAVAALFNNTCTQAPNGPATWGSGFATHNIFCTSGLTPLTWKHQVCVSCSLSPSTNLPLIRFQTASIPPYCFASASVTMRAADFEVPFNPSVTNSPASLVSFRTQNIFDTTVCEATKLNSPTVYNQINKYNTGHGSQNMNDIAGVALNGVLLLTSTSAQNVDPYFPKWWNGTTYTTFASEPLDLCLGLVDPTSNNYYYQLMPTCLLNASAQDATQTCASTPSCYSNLKSFMYSTLPSGPTQIMGVAKDGHMIVSPFNSTGGLISCSQLDQCGGMYLPDGSYVYVLTNSFPYTMNCFGPAAPQTFKPSCSQNACGSTAVKREALGVLSVLIILMLSSLL